MTQTIEQLTSRVRELEEENARLNAFMPTDCSNLTIRKTKSIFTDAGSTYKPSGFVLTDAEGKKCIVDMSAVRWMNGNDFFSTMHSDSTMAQQLAASQLREKQLRVALIAVRDDLELRMRIAEDDSLNISNSILDQMLDAIDLPRDTSALDAYVSEKVNEIIESHAPDGRNVTNAQHVEMRHKFLEQISTLTRQRDLAVDALEAIAGRRIFIDNLASNVDIAVMTLDAIKESEGK